jgi:hypothetical protein
MPRRASKPPAPPEIDDDEDALASALRVVEQATGGKLVEKAPKKNPHAVALSKLGASKGGQARAAKLSAAKRRAIAKKAAQARWQNRPAD